MRRTLSKISQGAVCQTGVGTRLLRMMGRFWRPRNTSISNKCDHTESARSMSHYLGVNRGPKKFRGCWAPAP